MLWLLLHIAVVGGSQRLIFQVLLLLPLRSWQLLWPMVSPRLHSLGRSSPALLPHNRGLRLRSWIPCHLLLLLLLLLLCHMPWLTMLSCAS
jgi:hypothetical protein